MKNITHLKQKALEASPSISYMIESYQSVEKILIHIKPARPHMQRERHQFQNKSGGAPSESPIFFCAELLDPKILDSNTHHQQDRFLSKSFTTDKLDEADSVMREIKRGSRIATSGTSHPEGQAQSR